MFWLDRTASYRGYKGHVDGRGVGLDGMDMPEPERDAMLDSRYLIIKATIPCNYGTFSAHVPHGDNWLDHCIKLKQQKLYNNTNNPTISSLSPIILSLESPVP